MNFDKKKIDNLIREDPKAAIDHINKLLKSGTHLLNINEFLDLDFQILKPNLV